MIMKSWKIMLIERLRIREIFAVLRRSIHGLCVLSVLQLAVEIYATWTQLREINEGMIQLTL